MKKLIFKPNVSVGSFVFGTEQEKVWEIMKSEFGSERNPLIDRQLPAYETEYYANPNVHLSYKDSKLISVDFIDDISKRYLEIYLGNEKIWPRTEKKFLSIFGYDSFVDIYGSYYHTDFSLAVGWDDNPPSLLIGQKGYCTEAVENFRLVNAILNMKKGMNRNECRMIINNTPQVSCDGRTDCYPHGIIRPEVTSLTFDSDNKLIKASQTFPNGEVVNFTLE